MAYMLELIGKQVYAAPGININVRSGPSVSSYVVKQVAGGALIGNITWVQLQKDGLWFKIAMSVPGSFGVPGIKTVYMRWDVTNFRNAYTKDGKVNTSPPKEDPWKSSGSTSQKKQPDMGVPDETQTISIQPTQEKSSGGGWLALAAVSVGLSWALFGSNSSQRKKR